MGLTLLKLKKISPSEHDSRVGLVLFTEMTRHPFTFATCCQYGLTDLQRKIKRVSLYDEQLLLSLTRGDHSDLSPDAIDIQNAFRRLRGMWMVYITTLFLSRAETS